MNDFVLGRVLPATGQGLVALVVAFALTRIFRRLPADSQAWIWRLAIGRFLLALVWEWPVAVLPGKVIPSSGNPVSPTAAVTLVERTASVVQSAPVNVISAHPGAMSDPVVSRTLSSGPGVDWTPLSWVWAIGTAGVVVIGLYRWLQLYKIARRGQVVSTRVRVSDEATVPFLVGNVIVLPSQMPTESRDVALAHEMAHRIRRDPLYSLPNFVVSALFWFVLPVWLALREYAIQVEIDCDRRALRLAGVSPRHYGSMLVALATGSNPPVGASAMAGGATALSRRLKAMKNHQNPRNLATLALTLAVGALVLTPVRPVAAALPRIQSAEIKQSQGKVDRAQRELNRAIAELNQAVKQSAAKSRQNDVYHVSVQRSAAKAAETLRAVDMTAPSPAPELAEVRAMPMQLSVDLARQQQAAKKLKLSVRAGDMEMAARDMQRDLSAQSLQLRIQRLERELQQLKRDVPPAPGFPAKAADSVSTLPVATGAIVTTTTTTADAMAIEARLGLTNEIQKLPSSAAAAVAAPTASAPIGVSETVVMKHDDSAVAADALVTKAKLVTFPESMPAKAAMASDDRRPRPGGSGAPKRTGQNIQFSAGKNGTITVLENGTVRTVRVNPKTHSVVVDGFTIYMDGKKTADGAFIIRVVGN